MTEPQARPTSSEPPTDLWPVARGTIRGEQWVMSIDVQGREIYVQFEGWIVGWPLHDLVEDSFEEVFGEQPDEFNFGGWAGGDGGNDGDE